MCCEGFVPHRPRRGRPGARDPSMQGTSANSRCPAADHLGLAVGSPLAPPCAKATTPSIAERHCSAKAVFTRPLTVQYGSFTDNAYHRRSDPGRTARPVGTIDACKFTGTGASIPRPCGIPPNCAPPVRTLVVFVDDKAGQHLKGGAY